MFPIASCAAAVGAGETAFARYIIPVVPFLCLAAALTVVEATRCHRALVAAARRGAGVCVGRGGAGGSSRRWHRRYHTDVLLSRVDNRLLAADWIRARWPEGASIAQTGTVAGQVQMATAAPDTPEQYPALAFEPETGRFFTSRRTGWNPRS